MAQEKNSTLKDRLRLALTEANMKPVDLSERTGIPKSMISYYLNGKTKPKADRIYVICQALDISEAWLLGYDVPKNRTAAQKTNDQLVPLIVRLRSDKELLETVLDLAKLSGEQLAAVKQLLSALRQ